MVRVGGRHSRIIFFWFQTDIASFCLFVLSGDRFGFFCLFVLSGDQLTYMQFQTDFYIVYPVSKHQLAPLDIGHAFVFLFHLFFLRLKIM